MQVHSSNSFRKDTNGVLWPFSAERCNHMDPVQSPICITEHDHNREKRSAFRQSASFIFYGAPCGARTHDLSLRRRTL